MALPTLDATFASSADLPRKQMLAKWLVEELGETQAPSSVLVSGLAVTNANGLYVQNGQNEGKNAYYLNINQSYIIWNAGNWLIEESEFGTIFNSNENVEFPWLVTSWTPLVGPESDPPIITEVPQPSPLSNYYSLPERYLWAKIAVAAGGPRTEADYISLPKNYVWSDIYNAVAGSSGNHTDWSENVALGHIAAAYRGDTANPANLATYIDWPWRYKVASIIDHLIGNYNAVIVSGLSDNSFNGIYIYNGDLNGRPSYSLNSTVNIFYIGVDDEGAWNLDNGEIGIATSSNVFYPWLATGWLENGLDPAGLVIAPTNV